MAETGNIKTFDSNIDKLNPSEVGAQAYEMEGRHVAAVYHQAGQDIGGGLASVGEQVEQHDTVVQTADLVKKMSDLEVQSHQDLLNARTTMDPNDPEAAGKFMENYKDQLQDITSKTYTPRAYEAMTRMTNDFTTRTKNNFTSYQSEAQANQALANLNGATANFANLANRDPTYIQSGVDAVKLASQTLPQEHRAEYVLQNTQHIYDSAGEGVTSRVEGMKVFSPSAVDAAKSYLLDPKNGFTTGMSAPKFAEIMNRLDNLRRTGGTQTIAGMELNGPAMIKNIAFSGGESPDFRGMISNLRNLGTPEGEAAAEKWEQEAQNAHGEYRARNIINNTPSDKLAEAHDELTNAANRSDLPGSDISTIEATRANFDKLQNERQTAFHGGDPVKQAQWMIDNNSGVRQAYEQWRHKPDDPQAFQSYYRKSVAQQRFLEPGSMPSVVTAYMENDASRINHELLDPKAGPMQAEQDLRKMSQTYGPAWPQIAGDLAKKKIFNGDQLVAAQLASNPRGQMYVRPLLQASAMTDKQMNDYSKISANKAIQIVHDNGELDKLEASMGNINNAPEIIANYVSAASKIVRLGNMDDATQLLKTMFTDNFQFVGPGNSIRLGADVPNGDAIGDGARSVLNDIGNHDLVVPFSANLGSVNAKEAFTDAIRANGIWNTSPNGRTATLYDGAGNPVMERGKNGKLQSITIDFDTLAKLGGTQNTVTQKTIDEETRHIK